MPSGGLYATYHLLRESETTIDVIFNFTNKAWSSPEHLRSHLYLDEENQGFYTLRKAVLHATQSNGQKNKQIQTWEIAYQIAMVGKTEVVKQIIPTNWFLFAWLWILLVESNIQNHPKEKTHKIIKTTSWWLKQPIWTICSSNWIIFPGMVRNKKRLKPPPRLVRVLQTHLSNASLPSCLLQGVLFFRGAMIAVVFCFFSKQRVHII